MAGVVRRLVRPGQGVRAGHSVASSDCSAPRLLPGGFSPGLVRAARRVLHVPDRRRLRPSGARRGSDGHVLPSFFIRLTQRSARSRSRSWKRSMIAERISTGLLATRAGRRAPLGRRRRRLRASTAAARRSAPRSSGCPSPAGRGGSAPHPRGESASERRLDGIRRPSVLLGISNRVGSIGPRPGREAGVRDVRRLRPAGMAPRRPRRAGTP